MYFSNAYLLISCIAMGISLILAIFSFLKKTRLSFSLGIGLIGAILVSLFYILSVYLTNDLTKSFMSSAYFLCVDGILVSFISFFSRFTEFNETKTIKILKYSFVGYFGIELILFMLNPICGNFVVDYIIDSTTIKHLEIYTYEMHPLYVIHLVYTYLMAIVCGALLIHKTITVPREYRNKYLFPLYGLIFVVLYNAAFLFLPKSTWNALDYSILGYALAAVFIYWCTFFYSDYKIMNKFRFALFDNLNQGIVLFNYENKTILFNTKAQSLLPNVQFNKDLTLESFLKDTKLAVNTSINDNYYAIQSSIEISGVLHPLRFEYRKIENDKGRLIARLFIIIDAQAETDPLTGFHNWESFKQSALENPKAYDYHTGVAVLDINQLALYNEAFGYEAGNKIIQELADLAYHAFSTDSYYIRGQDAALIVLYDKPNQDVEEILSNIKVKFSGNMQYTYLSINTKDNDILKDISTAFDGLKSKKLLDKESSHSNIISSLVKALQECDSDTEEHVVRTQAIGAKLGKKIGLSDVELSNLSLLCILHDIGKIGVPLDILNKPGKLSEEEWHTIQSHAEKGYNIARSSPNLSGIALMIKHHHERWDGKGYPDGLSKESIPLLSRIIAVVDAFDAMVSNRSYRKALPFEVAKEEIRKNAGTQFDPYIASSFLQMIEDDKLYEKQYTYEASTEETPVASTEQLQEQVEADTNNVVPINYSKYILDENMRVIQIDEMFTSITGFTKEDIENNVIVQNDLIPDDDRTEYQILATEQLGLHQMAYFEHRLLRKDKKVINVLCYGKIFYDSASKQMRSEIIIADIAKTNSMKIISKKLNDQAIKRLEVWEKQYRSDSLTGLLTHEAFQNDIETSLLNKTTVSLFMIDLDNFKKYNDTFGHHAGDEFLIYVSQALTSSVTANDLCCRMGGDEFAIAVLGDVDLAKTAKIIFNKIMLVLSSMENFTSISMGCAQSNNETDTFNKLYEAADKALYSSKDKGRNQYSL